MHEHLYHFWLEPRGPVLCCAVPGKLVDPETLRCNCRNRPLMITVDKDLVECQECLELLHA